MSLTAHPEAFELSRDSASALARLFRQYAAGKAFPEAPKGIQKELETMTETYVTASELDPPQLNDATWAAALHRDRRHMKTGRVGMLVFGLNENLKRLEVL